MPNGIRLHVKMQLEVTRMVRFVSWIRVCPATAPAQGGCRYNPAATPLPSRVVARRADNYCAAVRFWRQRLLVLAWSLPSGREGGLPRCHLCNCRCPRPCVPLAARRPGKRRLTRNSCPLPACTRPIDPHGQGRTEGKPPSRYLLLHCELAPSSCRQSDSSPLVLAFCAASRSNRSSVAAL